MTTKEYDCPFTFQELNEEEKKLSEWYDPTLVKLPPTKFAAPSLMKKYGKEILNLKPRSDDIWLIGMSRSGTTLTQEMLYILGTDFNYEKAASKVMDLRFPVLHSGIYFSVYGDNEFKDLPHLQGVAVPAHKRLEQMTEKRFIKSHFGLKFIHPELLESGCKVVFIARNPKDCIVSNYYYPQYMNLPGYNFKKAWPIFKNHFTNMGNYFELLKDGWENRNHKNVLFLLYEEVNADKRAATLKIANFLGKKITDDQLDTFLKHIDIKNFKQNKSLNNDHLVDSGFYAKTDNFSFIRKGKTGSWKELFPPEMVPEIDAWIKKELSEISGFKMPDSWEKIMELS